MDTFFGYETRQRLKADNNLLKLEALIDWKSIKKQLRAMKSQGIGRIGYDELLLFKAVLLGQWHCLSDPELETSLRCRLDYMLFCGLEFSSEVPDETTLCRYRNKLIDLGLDKKLFRVINDQLSERGLKVEEVKGAVIDATVIESVSRPHRVIEMSQDREELEVYQATDQEESKDRDARWLKKGKRSYYGYKGFIAVDHEAGYIEAVQVRPANESEVKQLESLIGELSPSKVYGDKGYHSQSNREYLSGRGIEDKLMYRASRNRPLTHWQKRHNQEISKKRYIVEQAFGTLKRLFGLRRFSYRGLSKTEGQMQLKAICFNLKKALNKVEMPGDVVAV